MRESDAYYSAIAQGYDALYGEEQDRKLAQFLARVELPRDATLLDVGCGTGRSAAMLPDVRWHGVEPAQGLIAHAPPGVRGRILQGAAERLPFPDASFDVVLSLTALQNFDDPAQGLREMRRVCKRGGALLVSFLARSPNAQLLDAAVRRELAVLDAWEDEKDAMYVCGEQ